MTRLPTAANPRIPFCGSRLVPPFLVGGRRGQMNALVGGDR